MKMFFSLFILYIFISFIFIICLITDRICFYDRVTRERLFIKPNTKVALAIYWPVLFYIFYRSIKDNIEER